MMIIIIIIKNQVKYTINIIMGGSRKMTISAENSTENLVLKDSRIR